MLSSYALSGPDTDLKEGSDEICMLPKFLLLFRVKGQVPMGGTGTDSLACCQSQQFELPRGVFPHLSDFWGCESQTPVIDVHDEAVVTMAVRSVSTSALKPITQIPA